MVHTLHSLTVAKGAHLSILVYFRSLEKIVAIIKACSKVLIYNLQGQYVLQLVCHGTHSQLEGRGDHLPIPTVSNYAVRFDNEVLDVALCELGHD